MNRIISSVRATVIGEVSDFDQGVGCAGLPCESVSKFLEVCHDFALVWCDVAETERPRQPSCMHIMEIEEVHLRRWRQTLE